MTMHRTKVRNRTLLGRTGEEDSKKFTVSGWQAFRPGTPAQTPDARRYRRAEVAASAEPPPGGREKSVTG